MQNSQPTDSASLELLSNRLNRLESRERRWRLVAGLAIAAAGVPWIVGAGFQPASTVSKPAPQIASQPVTTQPVAKPIAKPATKTAARPATPVADAPVDPAQPAAPAALRVTSLTLVGPDGAELANLTVEKGSPVLLLRQGDRHAMITLTDGNAGLACGGPGGVVFAGISGSGAYFNARGNDQQAGIYAGIDDKLNSAFRAYGSDMKVAASLDVNSTGNPSLTFNDPKTGTTQIPAPR